MFYMKQLLLVCLVLNVQQIFAQSYGSKSQTTNYTKIIKVELQKNSNNSSGSSLYAKNDNSSESSSRGYSTKFNKGKDGTIFPVFSPLIALGYVAGRGSHDFSSGIFLDFNIGRWVYFYNQLFLCYTTSISSGILATGWSMGIGWYFIKPPVHQGLSIAMNIAFGVGVVSQNAVGLLMRPVASFSFKYHINPRLAINIQPYVGLQIFNGQFALFSQIAIGVAI